MCSESFHLTFLVITFFETHDFSLGSFKVLWKEHIQLLDLITVVFFDLPWKAMCCFLMSVLNYKQKLEQVFIKSNTVSILITFRICFSTRCKINNPQTLSRSPNTKKIYVKLFILRYIKFVHYVNDSQFLHFLPIFLLLRYGIWLFQISLKLLETILTNWLWASMLRLLTYYIFTFDF